MAYASREAQREYQRNWIAARRRDYMKDKSCVRCGSVEELNLDHLDPTTKIAHSIWSWSKLRRDEELAKCQVLCFPCHASKTWNEDGRNRVTHGSHDMYTQGCRCDECRKAHSALAREWRAAGRKW